MGVTRDLDKYDYSSLPSLPSLPPKAKQEEKSEFQKVNEEVMGKIDQDQLEPVVDAAGGHGGFSTATVTLDNGETHNLFLKPLDEAEYNNFAFVQKECQGKEENSILKFMPRVYGVWADNNNPPNKFMVMANLRVDSEGTKWKQAADLKMTRGGQTDPEELKATGRDPKRVGVNVVQSLQEKFAPDYLALEKSKVRRTINAASFKSAFSDSLMEKLQGETKEKKVEALNGLSNQLRELKEQMQKSPMGFIGASIFVFYDKDQGFKIYLADPAHCQGNPEKQSDYSNKKMYWGGTTHLNENKEQFKQRVADNIRSIEAMEATVSGVKVPKIEEHRIPSSEPVSGRKRSYTKSSGTFTRIRRVSGAAFERLKLAVKI